MLLKKIIEFHLRLFGQYVEKINGNIVEEGGYDRK